METIVYDFKISKVKVAKTTESENVSPSYSSEARLQSFNT